jgi:hypothetical protein
MKRDAAARKFERLVVWKVSRLGRNVREVINTVHELADHGVTVYPHQIPNRTDQFSHGQATVGDSSVVRRNGERRTI